MAWLQLLLGGLFECAWAIGLKYTDGFTRPIPSILTVLAIVASMWLLALGARRLFFVGLVVAGIVGLKATA